MSAINTLFLEQRQKRFARFQSTKEVNVEHTSIIVFCNPVKESNEVKEPKEDNMTRWHLLKCVIETISFWSTLLDDDGVIV